MPDDISANPDFAGSVPYAYRIGKFEISKDMIDKANAQSAADGEPLGITKNTRSSDKPATGISWFEATKFVNWLNTSTGNTPAYKFDSDGIFQLWQTSDAGYNPNNLFRKSLAKYVLPSVDEWYKAAYYDPNSGVYFDYPTGSDTPPTPVASGTAEDTAVYDQLPSADLADITLAGGLSPYGTMGQGGNVSEWEETDLDLVNDSTSSFRGARGGWWSGSSDLLASSYWFINGSPGAKFFSVLGFRVASIPEPATSALALAALCLAMSRRRSF